MNRMDKYALELWRGGLSILFLRGGDPFSGGGTNTTRFPDYSAFSKAQQKDHDGYGVVLCRGLKVITFKYLVYWQIFVGEYKEHSQAVPFEKFSITGGPFGMRLWFRTKRWVLYNSREGTVIHSGRNYVYGPGSPYKDGPCFYYPGLHIHETALLNKVQTKSLIDVVNDVEENVEWIPDPLSNVTVPNYLPENI